MHRKTASVVTSKQPKERARIADSTITSCLRALASPPSSFSQGYYYYYYYY